MKEETIKKLLKFQSDRNWKQFHTPENLAKSISIEASELLEHFQWNNEFSQQEVEDELADVLIYSIYMADRLNVSIDEIILKKMKKNSIKYPIEKSKDKMIKYTKL